MLSKTVLLENRLIQEIMLGKYVPGKPVPSRNQLAVKYHCSRTVVERAIASLTSAGYLESRKGSGTFVLSNSPRREIRFVRVVSSRDVRQSEYSFSELLVNDETVGLPVGWVATDRTAESIDLLAKPGGAVIWQTPSYDQLWLLNHLRTKGIPQLLINRDYQGFDCVRTDPAAGIREGLSWLMIEAGRDIAFLSRVPSISRPYLPSRIIAFFEAGLELGARLTPDRCVLRSFEDIPREMAEIGVRLFGGASTPPKGIFVMDCELVLPLVMCAQGYGLTVGKDYKLLTFDEVPALAGYQGVGMMRQPYSLFRSEVRRWLVSGAALSPERFESALKTELLTCPVDRN